MLIGFGGSNRFDGGNRFDADLSDKINSLLSGTKSPEDRVDDFLEREIGIDPKSVPLTYDQALKSLTLLVASADRRQVVFHGNSLGLNSVTYGDEAAPQSFPRDTWREVLRIHAALQREHPEWMIITAKNDLGWQVTGRARDIPTTDPTGYPTGTALLVERFIADEDGPSELRREYVRVGGPYNDTEVTILSSLQPIDDPSSWTVVEVL